MEAIATLLSLRVRCGPGQHLGNAPVELRVAELDELDYLPLAGEAPSALFLVVSQCYLETSVVITTRRGVGAWGRPFSATPPPPPPCSTGSCTAPSFSTSTATPAASEPITPSRPAPPYRHRHPPTTTLTSANRWGNSTSTPIDLRERHHRSRPAGHRCVTPRPEAVLQSRTR